MINDNKADEIIYLGDIFQRGNEEVECLELLKESGAVCIKGNCELYAANGVDIDPDVEYLREYYDGIKSKLSDEQMNFVKGNVVAVSATGLENPSFLLIEVNEEELHFEHINII